MTDTETLFELEEQPLHSVPADQVCEACSWCRRPVNSSSYYRWQAAGREYRTHDNCYPKVVRHSEHPSHEYWRALPVHRWPVEYQVHA
jgi:hypothetical protein